jgi:DNA mismatch repair ATPase MutL
MFPPVLEPEPVDPGLNEPLNLSLVEEKKKQIFDELQQEIAKAEIEYQKIRQPLVTELEGLKKELDKLSVEEDAIKDAKKTVVNSLKIELQHLERQLLVDVVVPAPLDEKMTREEWIEVRKKTLKESIDRQNEKETDMLNAIYAKTGVYVHYLDKFFN